MTKFHGKRRLHKVYITLSCSGPETGSVRSGHRGTRRSRDGADLRFTTADGDFFYEHLKEPNYDTGSHEHHIRIINPDSRELRDAISSAGEHLSQYVSADDWAGGQITFCYAGHGEAGSGAWVLRDTSLNAVQLADAIAEAVVENWRRCRVDMIIDSCFSGAFVADFLAHSWSSLDERIFPCDILAASLHNELAWELEDFGQGAHTLAFKAMFLPKIVGPALPRYPPPFPQPQDELRNGGVSWVTEDEQHAIEYTNGHMQVHGAGHFYLHELSGSLTSEQVRIALEDALAVPFMTEVRMPS